MSISPRWNKAFFATVIIIIIMAFIYKMREKKDSIKIGIVYSLTGTMAVSEKPLVDAIIFAVEEINNNGGLLGRNVEIILTDGKSDDSVFAAEAERLIKEENISVLFACWISSCRKVVKPIVEKYQHLMIYTTQYEGLEESPNIIYIGSAPNQQIFPGTKWAMNRFGKKIFLIGSDYVFPHLANFMISDLVMGFKGSVLAEVYRPLGSHDFADVAQQIKKLKPDVVINTINGDSNLHFFRALKKVNLQRVPVLSFSLSEHELSQMGIEAALENHFSVWNYFESIDTKENKNFVARFKARFGQNRVASAPIINAYNSVLLWAQTVKRLETADVMRVNRSILHQSIVGPDGMHVLDIYSRHLWQKVLVGQADQAGQFKIVFSSSDLIRPEPFPIYRSKKEWSEIVAHILMKKRVL